MRSFRVRDVLSATLITLVGGWLTAALFGLWIATLQYREVAANLPLNQVAAAYDARIDHVLRHGLVLFLPQVAVMAAILVWQVARRSRRASNPQRYGAVTGSLLALVESVIAVIMALPWVYIALLWLLFIGTGVFGAWFSDS